MKKSLILFFLIISIYKLSAQKPIYVTMEDAMELSTNSTEYTIVEADSTIYILNDKLFRNKVLPRLNMSATLPNLNNSISPITKNDGSEEFVNRFYSSSSVSLSLSQLLPFTGGTFTTSSNISRLDNFNPKRSHSYTLNLINVSYNQKISRYNEYKWNKKLHEQQMTMNQLSVVQEKEKVRQRAVELFFSLYTEQRNVELNDMILELTQYAYERAKILNQQNKISDEDLLDAEIEYKRALQNTSQFRLEKARQDLRLFLKLTNDIIPVAIFDADIIKLYNFNYDTAYVIDRILEYNHDLINTYTELANEKQMMQLKSQSSASVSISMGGGVNSSAAHMGDLIDNNIRRMNFSVSLSLPILNWGENKTNIEILRQEIFKDELRYDSEREYAVAGYIEELQYVQHLIKDIRSQKELLDLMDRRTEILKIQLDHGKVDISKIISARNNLVRNEIGYINALHKLYGIIFKYRYLSLIDIRNNKTIN